MLKRQDKYDFILYEQRDFTAPYLEAKAQKNTKLEEAYLHLKRQKRFQEAYFTITGSKKTFFLTSEIISLAQAYDQAEIDFAKNPDHPERKNAFIDFFSEFQQDFAQTLTNFFQNLDEDDLDEFNAGNFFAEEARKLLSLIIDSETDIAALFTFQMSEELAKYRRKIAFKIYEKYLKNLLKLREMPPEKLAGFAHSYLTIQPKLKANFQIKILKLLGSNITKIQDPQALQIIQGIFR